MDRGAIAVWNSSNAGTVTSDSGALVGVPFSPDARFGLEAPPTGTTPEELLAAAYASCFTMTLAQRLAAAGHVVTRLHTEARVSLVRPSGYWEIPALRLHCTAIVPGIAEDEFLAIAHAARLGSPVARSMRAEVTLTVSLSSIPVREPYAPRQHA
jgi:lipoyl-dependent peroxiredoxin